MSEIAETESADDKASLPLGPTSPSEWSLTAKAMTTTAILVGTFLVIFSILHPSLIFADNTPTGGDMGAHVWGPAYLRDHLLPHFRLSGWSMDFYSGFPMYRFYMVVPALFIVILNIVFAYGIAFKIVVVLGLVTLPFTLWFLGRLGKMPYPMPELMAIGAVVFLLDESFTIYGGNIASTMAGEFMFSIALSFAFVGFALFARGLDDGKYRGWAAIAIALSAVSHGIVLIFVFVGVVVMWLMRMDRQRFTYGISTIVTAILLSSFWVVPFLGGHAFMTDMKYEPRPDSPTDSFMKMFFPLSTTWNILIFALALAGFVGAVLNRRFVGMWMGVYTIVLAIGVKLTQQSLPVIGLLWNPRLLPFVYLLRYCLAVLGVYEIGAAIVRFIRTEQYLRSVERAPDGELPPRPSNEPSLNVATSIAWLVAVVVLVIAGVRYQALPGGQLATNAQGKAEYNWGPLSFPASRAFSDGWAKWNFEGYEGKSTYGQYHDLVTTMKNIGKDPKYGCGRALWENNSDINKYGTTMALMLLPFWTDSCIASMEGLFFEAAGTTPYLFITASAMSKQSSNPVRELRYDDNKADIGVPYMRELGVKYYMAFTPEALAQARQQPDLEEIAVSGEWHIYRVKDVVLVEGLKKQPVVVSERSGDQRERWLELGTSFFQHRSDWAATPVADGPDQWQRIDVEVDMEQRVGNPGDDARRVDIVKPTKTIRDVPLDEVKVSNIKLGDDSISFDVDKVGVPVLVRVSYFPNWVASGAKGPYRAAPNMMVVVPTSKHVSMKYDTSGIDTFAWLLTLVGIGLTIWFFRKPFRYGVSLTSMDARR